MKFISCLCMTIALSVLVQCQQKLINIDYLGVGYDAIQGNPQNDIEDPGFKQSIFPLEYSMNVVTADGRFLIPDNTEAYQTTTCGYQTISEEIHDERSYRNSLSVCKTTLLLSSNNGFLISTLFYLLAVWLKAMQSISLSPDEAY